LQSAKYIYHAGLDWKQFDFTKGFDALMLIGDPEYIFYAGTHWTVFNHSVATDKLIFIGDCEYIYKAGYQWKWFDYYNGWKILESKIVEGRLWRGKALQTDVWKNALKKIWEKAIANQ